MLRQAFHGKPRGSFMRQGRRTVLTTLAVCSILISAGCNRPFADEATPDITVLSPDFSSILLNDTITLSIEADGFRDISAASVNGVDMTLDEQTGTWSIDWALINGVNELEVSVMDVAGSISDTTLYGVYLTYQVTPRTNMLQTATGGHAATILFNGNVLLTGGATSAGGPATNRAEILSGSGNSFQTLNGALVHARIGHTATLLPDGRVLIVGGSSTDFISSVSDLVEEAEFFNPGDTSFEPMHVIGDPIRRAFHTSSVRIVEGIVIVDLYGGIGDVQYSPESRLDTRADIRSFQVRGDTLIALSPAVGPNLPNAVSGHTQTPLENDIFSPSRYLVAGSSFESNSREDVSFVVDFTSDQGILTSEVGKFITPRTQHTTSRLTSQLALMWGGRQQGPASALNASELYILRASRFINIPVGNDFAPVKRYAHTTTVLAPGRAVIVGGFSTTGAAIPHAEFFDYEL